MAKTNVREHGEQMTEAGFFVEDSTDTDVEDPIVEVTSSFRVPAKKLKLFINQYTASALHELFHEGRLSLVQARPTVTLTPCIIHPAHKLLHERIAVRKQQTLARKEAQLSVRKARREERLKQVLQTTNP